MKRFLFSLSILAMAVSLAAPAAWAAQPGSGTVAPPNVSASWMGGPYTVGVPNQLGCLTASDPTCDAFALTVNLTLGYRFVVGIQGEIEGDDYSPCTLMFNYVDLQSLNFSTLEGATVRGHAVQYANP